MQEQLFINALKLLLALPVVILLAYISLRFTNQYLYRQNKHKNIQVIERIPIQNKVCLCLIKMGEEYMVIGVSENNFQILKTIKKEEIKNWKVQNKEVEYLNLKKTFHTKIKEYKKRNRKND
ncbi:flagellar biosynthetic protein FliO [Garciella nitratireducens]|uniref:Flagellar protein n=1 Tax=Garciella nitratireducens DSM 15102 TaxID=1121911 RepID=A0A1T4LD37_9FIRM|nr:flagellar biosynthetic protein FliO [Garciella nitratireducens]SJZ52625.1 flagellar protein FliO/FliZ [Garciella nitratireducens DSM 15102]